MDATSRRVVTVVFADLVGFTALAERLDPEDVAGIQDRYFTTAAEAVAQHGGRVEKFVGDAVMATFGAIPDARPVDARPVDDDAVSAVRAALGVVDAVRRVREELGLAPDVLAVRVGVESGEVVVSRDGGDWRVTGDAVVTAARLQTAAAPGEVLLGPAAAFAAEHAVRLGDAGPRDLKGLTHPVRTWRAEGLHPGAQRPGLGTLLGAPPPFVGRDEDLARLDALLDEDGTGGVLVVAPPGVGKTRLVDELVEVRRRRGGVCWSVRLARHPGQGYGAVRELLDQAGVDVDALRVAMRGLGRSPDEVDVDLEHVRDLLDGRPLRAEPDVLWRAWLMALDQVQAGLEARPVWLLEDLHLAGPDLRAFLAELTRHPDAPVLLATARPAPAVADVSDLRVGVEHLEPLHPGAVRSLVVGVLGAGVVADPYLDGVAAAARGNPLFAEELVRSWIQSGVLERVGDEWRMAGDRPVPVLPRTVQAIYQGQLDALSARARAVVERGSVPGTSFPRPALTALGVGDDAPVEALTRVGVLHGPHEDALSGAAYTYRHALLRDAAYGSLSRRSRAELHARFAEWLASLPESPTARELTGAHLALAVEQLPATAGDLHGTPVGALAERAAEALESASRTYLVSSPQRSVELAARALALPRLPQDPARTVRLHLLRAEAARRSQLLDDAMRAYLAAVAALDDADGAGDAGRPTGTPTPPDPVATLVEAALGYEGALFASRRPRARWGPDGLALLERAEAALPADDDATRSRLLAALGRARVYAGVTDDGALGQAVHLAGRSGDPAALAEALLAQRVALDPAALGTRLEQVRRAADAADLTEDLELRLEAHRHAFVDHLQAGDRARAEQERTVSEDLVRRLARPLWAWYPPMWSAMLALLGDDGDAAEEAVDRFEEEGRRARYADLPLVLALQRLRLHLDTGRASDVVPIVLRLAEESPDRWGFGAALVHAVAGEPAHARAALRPYVEADFRQVPRDLSWTTTMTHLAETAVALGEVDAARRIAELLVPWSGQVVVLGSGALSTGAVDRSIGSCLLLAGDEAAEAHLRRAVDLDTRLGAERWRAHGLALLGDPPSR